IFGPYATTQALYYASFSSGQVRRIVYTAGANGAPVAVLSASQRNGVAPLDVTFSAAGSTDPNGDPLAYDWDFGDGSAHASSATPSHIYQSGTYTATLQVSDGRGGSAIALARIDSGNAPPVPKITLPTDSARFRVGETIALEGSATDLEDGPLPDSSL